MQPLVAALPSRIPPQASRHFEGFRGERRVTQLIQREPFVRRATAWLGASVMFGGEDASGHHVHHQHHPATAHWLEADGALGWLRLRTAAPVRAEASPGRLEIVVETGIAWLREAAVGLEWVVQSGERAVLEGGALRLRARDGILRLVGGPSAPVLVAEDRSRGEQVWRTEFAPGMAPERLELELRLVR